MAGHGSTRPPAILILGDILPDPSPFSPVPASRAPLSGRPHPPSQMRALMQEWKRGRAVRELLPVARSIEDPSFAAEALFALATDPKLPAADAEKAALEGLRFSDKVERDWRRGEALAGMGGWLPDLRAHHKEAGAKVEAALLDRLLQLPAKPRADAMRAVAGHIAPAELPRVMARALASEEQALDIGKAILKAAVESGGAAQVLPAIRDCLDLELRARMLAAWASRMAPTQPEESGRVLGEMLNGAATLEPAVRLDVVRAFVAACEGPEPLHALHKWVAQQPEDEAAARLLSAMGARADKLGHADLAGSWLRQAQDRAARIPDEKARQSVQKNINEGLRRMGAFPDDVAAIGPPLGKAAAETAETADARRKPGAASARHVLALVDTYEGGLGEVHLRAVARAAPLCDAFGLDLALVGFPVKDVASFVKRAGRETNIGEGRGSLEALHREGRVHLVAVAEGEVPDVSALGTPVATTPNPDAAKATTEFPAGVGRLCVLVGLGPKGLPDGLLRACAVHVELTGKKVSLETATAMGVVAERMRTLGGS